jgi:hypothetical protein
LRLTADLNRLTDDHDDPVGYLGRAHPLVRRAIEHVRHVALGQTDGLDRRVSAARSPDGKPALLFTFLGRVNSQAGRELERVLAVRVTRDMQAQVITEGTAWLPQATEGVATKGLWEREFKEWGKSAQTVAETAARQAFDEMAADFIARHRQRIERRELDTWLEQRASEIVAESEQALPLFQNVVGITQTPVERLTDFIAQTGNGGRERSEAQTVMKIFLERRNALDNRLELVKAVLSFLGMMMFHGNS